MLLKASGDQHYLTRNKSVIFFFLCGQIDKKVSLNIKQKLPLGFPNKQTKTV